MLKPFPPAFIFIAAVVAISEPGPAFSRSEPAFSRSEPAFSRSERGEILRFERLSIEHGLSETAVSAILQDHVGFMWFGTIRGLNKYDGHKFTVYRNDVRKADSLSGDYVRAIYEDQRENLWIGTANGLDQYDRATDTFKRYLTDQASPGLRPRRVNVIYEDRSGTLWIGTHRSGLFELDRSRERLTRYAHDPKNSNSLNSDEVWAIHEDREGTLWVGTDGGGLNRFDRREERWTHYLPIAGKADSLSHNEVRTIVEIAPGFLWIGTKHGLNRLDVLRGTFEHWRTEPEHIGSPGGPGGNSIYSILRENWTELWLGTNNGLDKFDTETEATLRHLHQRDDPSSLIGNQVRSLYKDRSGVLWVGANGGGVGRSLEVPAQFKYYDLGLEGAKVEAVHEDDRGMLWIGTCGQGLWELDRRDGSAISHRPEKEVGSLSTRDVWVVRGDGRNSLWVGSQSLDKYDLTTRKFITQPLGNWHGWIDPDVNGKEHPDVRAMLLVDSHTALLGTDYGLISFTLETRQSTHYRHHPADPFSLSDDHIRSIYRDSSETLWIGTSSGLNRFDPTTGTFHRFLPDPGNLDSLSDGFVYSILEDSSGVLWVGTSAGLNRYDSARESFQRFTKDDGLASNRIECLLEDHDRNLWIGSDRGLSRFDPRTRAVRNYTRSDGLESDLLSTCLATRDGELIFGGGSGLVAFDPRQLPRNPHAPPIVLTSFSVSGAAMDLGQPASEIETIRLSHKEDSFTFEFAALDYTSPARNQYAHQLVGFDDDWTYNGSKRSASYTNVGPGDYRFRVKGANNDGVWNERGLTVELRIDPPYWERWWFLSASVLMLACLTAAGHQARMRGVHKNNERLEAANALLNEEIYRRRQAEEQREQFIAELEVKKAKVEAQNAELERFTYTVSHDLKSPLVTIRGFLGLLEKDAAGGDSGAMKQDIEHIDSAAAKMAELLDDLLELSRVGRVASHRHEVDMNELVAEALCQVAGQITAAGVEIEVSPGLPPVVGDRRRLLEVLQNLIDNGVKFMGDQPRPRIRIGFRGEADGIVYFVRDNGVGIDPRYQSLIFGLFERLDQEIDGTGIGLALVRRIVEVHGGRIWAESEGQGKGAAFCFTIS